MQKSIWKSIGNISLIFLKWAHPYIWDVGFSLYQYQKQTGGNMFDIIRENWLALVIITLLGYMVTYYIHQLDRIKKENLKLKQELIKVLNNHSAYIAFFKGYLSEYNTEIEFKSLEQNLYPKEIEKIFTGKKQVLENKEKISIHSLAKIENILQNESN
jgi:hypothetical protein